MCMCLCLQALKLKQSYLEEVSSCRVDGVVGFVIFYLLMIEEIWINLTVVKELGFFPPESESKVWCEKINKNNWWTATDYPGKQKVFWVYNSERMFVFSEALYFSCYFRFTEKLDRSTEFPYTHSAPYTVSPVIYILSCINLVCLLQLISQYCYIISS